MIKWLWLMRYPEGVPVEEGEKWYFEVHTQEAKNFPDLKKYLTWKVLDVPERPTNFVRVTELWYDSLESWRHTYAVRHQYLKTPGPGGVLDPPAEVVCIDEKSGYDLMRGIPKL